VQNRWQPIPRGKCRLFLGQTLNNSGYAGPQSALSHSNDPVKEPLA
jgi:hypothetical protein